MQKLRGSKFHLVDDPKSNTETCCYGGETFVDIRCSYGDRFQVY